MGVDEASPTDARSLASTLAPHLARECDDRLGDIAWFKTDWQRGGAATGRATWTAEDGSTHPAVVKLPVVQRELTWMRRLQPEPGSGADPVVPRLFAGGMAINGYDLAWIVMESFPCGPLGMHWDDTNTARMAEALARFHAAAARHAVDQPPRREDWPDLLQRALEAVRTNRPDHADGWTEAIKTLLKRLDDYTAEWRARRVDTWLHGDAHLANAMTRSDDAEAEVALIDLAEVHAGHWVEDAVYLERQLWAFPDRLKATKPVRAVGRARKALGLRQTAQDSRLAMIRRVLLAGTAPAFMRSEGHPAHLAACLRWLEIGLADLK